jgi:acetyl esterase
MSDSSPAAAPPIRLDLESVIALGAHVMPDLERMSPVEAREVLAAIPARPGPAVESATDVVISDGVGGRRYVPVGGDAGPLVVYFHGGGFTLGNVETYDGSARRLCASLGLSLVSVEYRLAPEHPFPAAIDDAWTAFAWASRAAGDRGLIVAGDSAGANLAAVTARRAAAEGIEVVHQLLVYPCFDPSRSLPSHSEPGTATGFLSSQDMGWYWEQYLGRARPSGAGDDIDERVDPRRAEVPGGLAPATVVVAGRDPLHDEGGAYAGQLRSAGVEVTLLDFPDLFHGFAGFAELNEECWSAFDDIVSTVTRAIGSSTSGR